jgi:hypothetical protein
MNFWNLVGARVKKLAVKCKEGNLPTKIQLPLLSIYGSSSINDIIFFLEAVTANSTNRTKSNFSLLFFWNWVLITRRFYGRKF